MSVGGETTAAFWNGCLAGGGKERAEWQAQLQGLQVFVQVVPKQENLGELSYITPTLEEGSACISGGTFC